MFSSPFVACPYCGEIAFGIAVVGRNRYTRRCRSCFRPKGRERHIACLLPSLSKKIIYVDQMAISNMMKAIHPDTPAKTRAKLDPFWLEAYKKLDVICRLQLAVCPASDIHRHESQLWREKFEDLREMYRHLSGGVSFKDHLTIQRFQLGSRLISELTGSSYDQARPTSNSVFFSEVNGWWDRVQISVNLNYDPAWVDEYATSRKRIQNGLAEVFARWQSETGRTFEDWYNEEALSFGPSIIEAFRRNLLGIHTAALLGQPLTLEQALNEASTTITTLKVICTDHGVPRERVLSRVYEFLNSEALLDLPSNRISSLIYAAIARKAAAGQKSPPNVGMAADVDSISCFLPYCDAIFVDNACRAYLTEEPVPDRLGYSTKVFSQKTREAFLAYLDEIRAAPPPYIVDCAKELYGPDCDEPFTELYARR